MVIKKLDIFLIDLSFMVIKIFEKINLKNILVMEYLVMVIGKRNNSIIGSTDYGAWYLNDVFECSWLLP